MTEHFLTYKQSLAVKELGFDESTFASYINKKLTTTLDCVLWGDIDIDIPAPLKSQFFKWVREKHNLYYSVEHYQNDKNILLYNIVIWSKDNEILHDKDEYKTYEQAEDACINKIIKILKLK